MRYKDIKGNMTHELLWILLKSVLSKLLRIINKKQYYPQTLWLISLYSPFIGHACVFSAAEYWSPNCLNSSPVQKKHAQLNYTMRMKSTPISSSESYSSPQLHQMNALRREYKKKILSSINQPIHRYI